MKKIASYTKEHFLTIVVIGAVIIILVKVVGGFIMDPNCVNLELERPLSLSYAQAFLCEIF